MRKQYKNLDYLAQLVWAAPDLPTKKKLANQMVDEFQFKKRQQFFRHKISRAPNADALDFLAANLTLLSSSKTSPEEPRTDSVPSA